MKRVLYVRVFKISLSLSLSSNLQIFNWIREAPRPTSLCTRQIHKPPGWDMPPVHRPWQGGEWIRWEVDGMAIRHGRYRKQIGWKSTPAARKGRWIGMVDEIIRRGTPS